jgi:hypothetical protein
MDDRDAVVRSYPEPVQLALAKWEAEKLARTEQAKRAQRASVQVRLSRRGARARARAAQARRYLLEQRR